MTHTVNTRITEEDGQAVERAPFVENDLWTEAMIAMMESWASMDQAQAHWSMGRFDDSYPSAIFSAPHHRLKPILCGLLNLEGPAQDIYQVSCDAMYNLEQHPTIARLFWDMRGVAGRLTPLLNLLALYQMMHSPESERAEAIATVLDHGLKEISQHQNNMMTAVRGISSHVSNIRRAFDFRDDTVLVYAESIRHKADAAAPPDDDFIDF